MPDGTAVAEQWLAERRALRNQIILSRQNLVYAVENALEDLGDIGRHRVELIVSDIQDELDDIEDLIGADDDA